MVLKKHINERKRLSKQVRRNLRRFPIEFMLTLTVQEFEILKSQNATTSWEGRRSTPNAFTEFGVLMLSTVLKSEQAIQNNSYLIEVTTQVP